MLDESKIEVFQTTWGVTIEFYSDWDSASKTFNKQELGELISKLIALYKTKFDEQSLYACDTSGDVHASALATQMELEEG